MATKQKTPAPIDRPLSRAYLREFSGWSTAFSPGLSEPTSLRLMENTMINKDGSLRIRPGLKYLSYTPTGMALQETPVGTHEAFYLSDGRKAYLFAVRESDDTVGFRVLIPDVVSPEVLRLTDTGIEFTIIPSESGVDGINFTSATSYVKYLQIDNIIFALSNAGEPMRMFEVGTLDPDGNLQYIARRLTSVDVPSWDFHDKLNIIQPDDTFVTGNLIGTRVNELFNPSFVNLANWTLSANGSIESGGVEGSTMLRLRPQPERTNLQKVPLRSTATADVADWTQYGSGHVTLSAVASAIRATITCTRMGGQGFARQPYANGADVVPGTSYKAAFDLTAITSDTTPVAYIQYVNAANAVIGRSAEFTFSSTLGRKTTPSWTPPAGTARAVILIGGKRSTTSGATRYVQFNQILIARSTEPTTFFSGADGAGYTWAGTPDESASYFTAEDSASAESNLFLVDPAQDVTVSIYGKASYAGAELRLGVNWYDATKDLITSDETSSSIDDGSYTRLSLTAAAPALTKYAALYVITDTLDPVLDQYVDVDAALAEKASALGDYFDGSTDDTLILVNSWKGGTNNSASMQNEYEPLTELPTPETKTGTTLISSDADDNVYNVGMFYGFENEVGESAFSQTKVIRVQRPWAGWLWLTPAGDPTDNPEACADQLIAIMPEDVFNAAMEARATNWNLYMLTWSDQAPVPVEGIKIAEVALDENSTYINQGWARMTPQVISTEETAAVPTETNRFNYSNPTSGGQGLVAADRMVIVRDPVQPARIVWSANQQGEYHNFSASRGGGYKTLTSGNLFVPAAVKLWQNPQSVDTLTILCEGTDGHSTGYYMAPAEVTSQSDSTPIMGFEETTATPGTTSPYGCEVFNNALYHPLDDQLMKSTASNYNINHKSITDQIENKWSQLIDKDQIVSSQLDKRLYYIVHNPEGVPAPEGCNGNEIWIHDAEAEAGTWSRLLIPAVSLRKIEVGGIVCMSVISADGIYYLDPFADHDDYVDDAGAVATRYIPWKIETNTQGANRAHDAWCHLRKIEIMLGSFYGTMEWGMRSWDRNGKAVEIKKTYRDLRVTDPDIAEPSEKLFYDIEDHMQVNRELQQWFFYAHSLDDDEGETLQSFGSINYLQYRYAPISVNQGYEYGSVETFEYARSIVNDESRTTFNGVPIPMTETRRP